MRVMTDREKMDVLDDIAELIKDNFHAKKSVVAYPPIQAALLGVIRKRREMDSELVAKIEKLLEIS